MTNEKKFPSELRYDVISKDWVIVAKARAKKLMAFKKEKRKKIKLPKEKCPFCNIETQLPPVLILKNGQEMKLDKIARDWTTIVIPNKFPALLPNKKLEKKKEGKFYETIKGIGYCELVITKDHEKHFPHFSIEQVEEVFTAYQKRILFLSSKKFVNYVSIFHNHGLEAGASQPHPHSQIIATPLIDIDLKKALFNSYKFFQKYRKCIYCEMQKWEMKVKKRIVFENKEFLVLCPFASKTAFEMIVTPKKHSCCFEKIKNSSKKYLAQAFQKAMKTLDKTLKDPPYNFYLHTAPIKEQSRWKFYHWHFTILPKTSIPAGFELGTKMEISTIEPEKAAEYLRKNI